MEEYYKTNKDFRGYVDKYCKHYGYSVSESLTHAIVREKYLDYLEKKEEVQWQI